VIDFGDTGSVTVHKINGRGCVQFFPSEQHTVKDMLAIMDAGLKVMNDDSDSMTVERGILLNTESRAKQGYPIPCVLLFKEE